MTAALFVHLSLFAVLLPAACRQPEPPKSEAEPAPAPMMDQKTADRYVKGLREAVRKAEEAKKAGAKTK